MRNTLVKIIILLFIFLIVACSNCTESQDKDVLHNVWVAQDEDFRNPKTLKSADEFDKNKYGFKILSDGVFIERKNSGWCGTPPIAYSNFYGAWEKLSEDTLEVVVEFWGGIEVFKMEILSINEDELIINYIYDYEE